MAKRCFQKLESEELNDDFKNPKKRFHSAGGGRKKKAPEVREELFQWFIDVRTSLQARLPKNVLFCRHKNCMTIG